MFDFPTEGQSYVYTNLGGQSLIKLNWWYLPFYTWIVSGTLAIEFRDRTVTLGPGELIVVPRGVEHRPVAAEEVAVLLFEPAATVNTGNATDDPRTRSAVPRV